MNCQAKLEALGLPPERAAAALHYLADHLAHTLHPNPEGVQLYRLAYRCAVRDCCDELRRQAGDPVTTAPVGLLPAAVELAA